MRRLTTLLHLGLSIGAALPVLSLAQPRSDSALQGLYVEFRVVTGGRVPVHYYFWKDGRYCDGLPAGGIEREPADFADLKTQLPCGEYKQSTGFVSLSANERSPAREIRLQRNGYEKNGDEKLSMNGNAAYKIAALPGAAAMAGAYSAMVTGSQSSRQVYEFRADGTYRFTSSPMTSEDGSPARQAGVFKAQGNSLQLSNSPGGGASGVERLTAYPYPGGGLMIEGTVFTR